jgi:hypothetical protein
LEGLAHVWRVIGYYLGMPDESNCVGKCFDQTQKTIRQMSKSIFVPMYLRTNRISILMGRNAAKALFFDYYVTMYITLQRKPLLVVHCFVVKKIQFLPLRQ